MPLGYNPSVARELNTRLVLAFDEGVDAATKADADVFRIFDVAMMSPSDTASNTYLFTGKRNSLKRKSTKVKEWQTRGVRVYELEVGNSDVWYDAIAINRYDFDDDKIGQYISVFNELGYESVIAFPEMMEAAILSADSMTCFDGQPLLSESHPLFPGQTGSTTWSNIFYAGASGTFDLDTYEEAEARMAEIPREDGESARVKPRVVLCGPRRRRQVEEVLENFRPRAYAGGENPRAGKFDVIEVPNMPASKIQLIDNSNPKRRPYIWQERDGLRLIEMFTDPSNEAHKAFIEQNDEYQWALKCRAKAAPGYPHQVLEIRFENDPTP